MRQILSPLTLLKIVRCAYLLKPYTLRLTICGSGVAKSIRQLFFSFFSLKIIRINGRGFTLVELMLVVAIMAVLAGIATPHYQSFVERAKGKTVEKDMKMIEMEIISYNLAYGRYPNDLKEIGLDTLVDPWGNPYRYLNIADANGKFKGKNKPRKDHNLHPVNTDFDLYSMGPDGDSKLPFTAKHSRDDYIRANNGAFFGKVSDY